MATHLAEKRRETVSQETRLSEMSLIRNRPKRNSLNSGYFLQGFLFGGAPHYLANICSPRLVGLTDDIFGSHVGFYLSFSFSRSFTVSHFTAELIRCGWAVQAPPSGSALLDHAKQEVAKTAVCNST
ncbi:hypothetical protein JOB18_010771 [Solea senegalensis]|uniref:Uncharacterized protein n=1 Tax=Solea senegalensis TaxID=28829 RepID=A0AAV6QRL1_SOLSE|nr:hypothetical protein JOB18_010771 [Solea senegalensis]